MKSIQTDQNSKHLLINWLLLYIRNHHIARNINPKQKVVNEINYVFQINQTSAASEIYKTYKIPFTFNFFLLIRIKNLPRYRSETDSSAHS